MFTHMQYVYTYVCIDTYMYVHTHAQSPEYFGTPYAVTKHRDLNILQVSFHFGLQFRGVKVHCGAAVADEAAGTGSWEYTSFTVSMEQKELTRTG